MRITRLQLLIAFICLIGLAYASFRLLMVRSATLPSRERQPLSTPPLPTPSTTTTVSPVAPPQVDVHQQTARLVADVGEAYRALAKKWGEVPEIQHDLRQAKQALTEGHTEAATASARSAWARLKGFHVPTTHGRGWYNVVHGDTLWRIAKRHSPVHRGAAWVAIWKANKRLIKDFNRLEVGWSLRIPQRRSDYIMPYWKPPRE